MHGPDENPMGDAPLTTEEADARATPDVIEGAGLDEESVQMAIETTKVDCGDPGHNVSEIIEELYAEYRAIRAERDGLHRIVADLGDEIQRLRSRLEEVEGEFREIETLCENEMHSPVSDTLHRVSQIARHARLKLNP